MLQQRGCARAIVNFCQLDADVSLTVQMHTEGHAYTVHMQAANAFLMQCTFVSLHHTS
jgi:hypothetical protein